MRLLLIAAMILSLGVISSTAVFPHCDTLDGPVVSDAKAALDKGNLTPVLKWVSKANEPEIRAAFDKTLQVRSKGADAKELADTYFFETLVRVHRMGENAPYTGLKPAGAVEPAIAAADKALENGQVDALAKAVADKVAAGIKDRFTHVAEAKKHSNDSVAAGREYVEAYVTFIHYVERLQADAEAQAAHEAASGSTHVD